MIFWLGNNLVFYTEDYLVFSQEKLYYVAYRCYCLLDYKLVMLIIKKLSTERSKLCVT